MFVANMFDQITVPPRLVGAPLAVDPSDLLHYDGVLVPDVLGQNAPALGLIGALVAPHPLHLVGGRVPAQDVLLERRLLLRLIGAVSAQTLRLRPVVALAAVKPLDLVLSRVLVEDVLVEGVFHLRLEGTMCAFVPLDRFQVFGGRVLAAHVPAQLRLHLGLVQALGALVNVSLLEGGVLVEDVGFELAAAFGFVRALLAFEPVDRVRGGMLVEDMLL